MNGSAYKIKKYFNCILFHKTEYFIMCSSFIVLCHLLATERSHKNCFWKKMDKISMINGISNIILNKKILYM